MLNRFEAAARSTARQVSNRPRSRRLPLPTISTRWSRPCSPCIFDECQLGPLVDKDALISADRQMGYALEFLAGVRPGEAAALRGWHYDPTVTPLGKILVAKSFNTDAARAYAARRTTFGTSMIWRARSWRAQIRATASRPTDS